MLDGMHGETPQGKDHGAAELGFSERRGRPAPWRGPLRLRGRPYRSRTGAAAPSPRRPKAATVSRGPAQATVPSPYAVVAIGASFGGVAALQEIAAGLDPNAPAAYFVVLHVGPYRSRLPSVLNMAGMVPAQFAEHGALIVPRRIFVAPPDHHLVLSEDRMFLSRGPRENRSRPAIDPLFRSVAHRFDGRAVGVVLTGLFNDGTAGLREIAMCRGVTVVQDPGEAECPDMPASAIRHVAVDHWLPVAAIPPLLSTLAREIVKRQQEEVG
jgi:chemotaxis response regulator CheB